MEWLWSSTWLDPPKYGQLHFQALNPPLKGWILKLAPIDQRSWTSAALGSNHAAMSDFLGGHWGSMLVVGPFGAGVGAEGRTYVSLFLLQAAAPNLAQICGGVLRYASWPLFAFERVSQLWGRSCPILSEIICCCANKPGNSPCSGDGQM
eukprot:1153871-Pelagomonas_calceolata.AAC.6